MRELYFQLNAASENLWVYLEFNNYH